MYCGNAINCRWTEYVQPTTNLRPVSTPNTPSSPKSANPKFAIARRYPGCVTVLPYRTPTHLVYRYIDAYVRIWCTRGKSAANPIFVSFCLCERPQPWAPATLVPPCIVMPGGQKFSPTCPLTDGPTSVSPLDWVFLSLVPLGVFGWRARH